MTARAKTVLGQHKILTFDEYKLPDLSESNHRVNLVKSDKDKSIIAEGLSLQELHDNYVKDGQLLYSADRPNPVFAQDYEKLRESDYATENNNYALMEPYQTQISKKNTAAGEQLGALKIIIFALSSPIDYAKAVLDRAYQFVALGCSVEIRIRVKGKKLTKQERLQPGNPETLPWIHKHFPHLRPDIIKKSMPEGTQFLIKPWSDGRIVQWVLHKPWKGMPATKLDERLARVKESVMRSIKQGKQSQLPQILRQRLHDEGNQEYSPYTGLPREQARAKFSKPGGHLRMSGEERKRMAQDAESTRFMVPPDQPEEGSNTSTQDQSSEALRKVAEFKKGLDEGQSVVRKLMEREDTPKERKGTPEGRRTDMRPRNRWEGRGKVGRR
jgi:hypothetical protein